MEKITLKVMQCPTCGVSLKVENSSDPIVCVYCGNTIIPVKEESSATARDISGAPGAAIRVDGIKTASSALAYMEILFEEYDWDAFAYNEAVSVAKADELAESLRVTSADDKGTWILCFRATAIPFLKKIEGCKRILEKAINEYKKGDFEAYSKFDAYKRVSKAVLSSKATVIEKLEKTIKKAEKYGATAEERGELISLVEPLRVDPVLNLYESFEEIPEISDFNREKNDRIAQRLAEEGINAESEYERAKSLIYGDKHVAALTVLRSIRGYKDTDVIIENIDKIFFISDAVEIDGRLYGFGKASPESQTMNLYRTAHGEIIDKPVIKGIKRIVINYADVLYYIDRKNRLRKYNLSKNTDERLCNNIYLKGEIYAYDRRVFLTVKASRDESSRSTSTVVELDSATGKVKKFLKGISEILSLTESKMIYTVFSKKSSKYETNIIDVDTKNIVRLGSKQINVEGFVDDFVIYTQMSPNEFNKNLYVRSFKGGSYETLIEKNIYKFCDVINGRLFYYVGNAKNKSLININLDGTERREWSLYISSLLFEQGGWVYFIRKSGYNAILCKARTDGSCFTVIAKDIDKFIEIKNGYLYFINDVSALMRVRMDGSNLEKLCDDVEEVLSVKENKIVFISVDGKIKSDDEGVTRTKTVKSLYAVDFTGGGKTKLAYDIKSAKKYGENTVYYVAAKEINSSYVVLRQDEEILYSLDVETGHSEKLLKLGVCRRMPPVALLIAAGAFFASVILFAAGSLEFGAGFIGVGVAALAVEIALRIRRGK